MRLKIVMGNQISNIISIILLMGTFDRSLMTNELMEILVSIKKRLG